MNKIFGQLEKVSDVGNYLTLKDKARVKTKSEIDFIKTSFVKKWIKFMRIVLIINPLSI